MFPVLLATPRLLKDVVRALDWGGLYVMGEILSCYLRVRVKSAVPVTGDVRDARAGLRVRVLHRLTTYQIYRSNFVVLGFERPMSLSSTYEYLYTVVYKYLRYL